MKTKQTDPTDFLLQYSDFAAFFLFNLNTHQLIILIILVQSTGDRSTSNLL